jgi:hypothetical protein
LVLGFVCFKIDLPSLFVYGVTGWISEHIISGVYTILADSVQIPKKTFYGYLIQLACFVIQDVFFLFAILKWKKSGMSVKKGVLVFTVSIIALLYVSVLSQFKRFLGIDDSSLVEIYVNIYEVILSLFVVAIQLGLLQVQHLEEDNRRMEKMMRDQAKMYQNSKESIDLINIKYHDLKKQINMIEKSGITEKDKTAIEEVKTGITNYESLAKTGNEAIDILLSEKALVLEKNRIRLSYIMDGNLLSFMPSVDVFSLVGNALDNAIEAVIQEEEDHRIISMKLYEKNSLILFEIQNYTSKQIDMKKITTTKKDADYHGFGMKAMDYIVRKYDGTLNLNCANSLFTLIAVFSEKDRQIKDPGKENEKLS